MLLTNKQRALVIEAAFCFGLAITRLGAQPATSDKLEFDVASVKVNKSGDAVAASNNPLGPGTVWNPTGGFFTATNYPLITYISFAYKIMGNQEQALRSQMPPWVINEPLDIQARSNGNPTKDETRLMMRSLLADRFKLAIHTETRQLPVLALILAKPGKMGPRLQPHPDGSCMTDPSPPPTQLIGPYPALCGGLLPLPPSAPGLLSFGARNVTMGFIANQLAAMGRSDRPVLDQTGLTGSFDFALEWAYEPNAAQPADADLPTGATFLEAVREQLGIKLESHKGPVDVLVLGHVERLSEN